MIKNYLPFFFESLIAAAPPPFLILVRGMIFLMVLLERRPTLAFIAEDRGIDLPLDELVFLSRCLRLGEPRYVRTTFGFKADVAAILFAV